MSEDNLESENFVNKNSDIEIETINTKQSYQKQKQSVTRERNVATKTEISDEELKKIINSFEPTPITDYYKKPYKTIMIVFLLLFSGALFYTMGVYKFFTDGTWDQYVSYTMLGGLLLIPGIYYTFHIVNIWIGTKGYSYEMLPDLSEN